MPRWRPRFSLRTLLLATLLCGSGALLWQNHGPWQVRMAIRETFAIHSIGFAPDDSYFYTQTIEHPTPDGRSTINIYDYQSGKLLSQIRGEPRYSLTTMYALKDLFITRHYKRGGKNESEGDRIIQIRRPQSGELVKRNDIPEDKLRIYSVSKNGNFALLNTESRYWLVRLPSFEKLLDLSEFDIQNSEISDNEDWLAFSVRTPTQTEIRVISTISPQPPRIIGILKPYVMSEHPESIVNFAFSPDSRLFLFYDFDTFDTTLVDINDGQTNSSFPGKFGGFSDDSRLLLTRADTYTAANSKWTRTNKVWDLKTKAMLYEFQTGTDSYSKFVNEQLIVRSSSFVARLDAQTGATIFSIPYTNSSSGFASNGQLFYLYKSYQGEILINSFGKIFQEIEEPPDVALNLYFAKIHSEFVTCSGRSPEDTSSENEVKIWSQRRPEYWYGYAWLWEFWLFVALLGACIWSLFQPVSPRSG